MKSLVWLSFDLGVSGDYEGMYAWLDEKEAKECGNSVACFWCEHDGEVTDTIKTEIQDRISLNKRSRIYLAYRDDSGLKGRFIVGRRKSPPWDGYGMQEECYDDQEFG